MSDCPGTVGKIAFHCPGCQENERLRAQLAQARDGLRSLLSILDSAAFTGLAAFAFAHGYRCCSDEETARNITVISKVRALADLDEKEKEN